MASRIGIIDYGMGNLHSIHKALEFVAPSERVEISYDPDKLRRCDRLIFPGVGAIRPCVDELRRLELDRMLREFTQARPVLGICLGMQALFTHCAESGGMPGLALIPGQVHAFSALPQGDGVERVKVPHMGWNQVRQERRHPLWTGLAQDSWFYFVHSFYALPDQTEDTLGTTEYGERFTSVALRDNILAVQFHLEKSQRAGLTLLANFVQWDGRA